MGGTVTTEEPRRIERCPTCGQVDFEYVEDDVVRCRNCTRLWVLPRREDAGGGAG